MGPLQYTPVRQEGEEEDKPKANQTHDDRLQQITAPLGRSNHQRRHLLP